MSGSENQALEPYAWCASEKHESPQDIEHCEPLGSTYSFGNKMTSDRLKSKVLLATIVSAIFGLGIIVYIGFVAFGASEDAFSLAFHPFVGFYGGDTRFTWWFQHHEGVFCREGFTSIYLQFSSRSHWSRWSRY